AFSDDGKILASANTEGIFLWDPETGKELRRLKGHQDYVAGLTFAPNGKLLASAGADKLIRLWDVAAGKEVRRFDIQFPWKSVVFSPDSKLLAFADRLVHVWDLSSGGEIRQFALPWGYETGLAFSASGRFLAQSRIEDRISPEDQTRIVLWELLSG